MQVCQLAGLVDILQSKTILIPAVHLLHTFDVNEEQVQLLAEILPAQVTNDMHSCPQKNPAILCHQATTGCPWCRTVS